MGKNFDLIIFDLDGTLTDSSEGITKSIQYCLEKYDIHETDLDSLKRFVGPSLLDSLMNSYGFSKEEGDRACEIFNERYEPIGWKENYLYDGILNVLDALKEEGKLMGIATAKPLDMAENVLEYFDLNKYFPILCAATSNGINGDKAGRIRATLEEAKARGFEVKNPIMVGDTKFDVMGAHECDVPCIGVTWGFAQAGDLEACNTEYIVNTMDELLKLLSDK